MMPTMKDIIAARNWTDWWKIDTTPAQPLAVDTTKTDADLILDFLVPRMQFAKGARLAWEVVYEWYCSDWADGPENVKCLSVAEFGAALAEICERTPIRVHKARGRVWCLDVRLIDPSLKALVGPGKTGHSPHG